MRLKPQFLACLGLCFFLSLSYGAETKRGPACLRLGFKNPDLKGWSLTRMPPGAWKIVPDPDPAHGKDKVILIEIGSETKELQNLKGVTDGYRAELKDDDSAPVGRYSWYRFSFFIPKDYPAADAQNPAVLAQWHDRFDEGEADYDRSPPLAMRLKEDRLYFTVQYGQKDNPSINRLISEDALIPFSKPVIERGVWHQVEAEILWSNRENGRLKIRLDGAEVVSRDGPIGYDYSRGPYFKMGIYNAKSPFLSRHRVYFGEYNRVLGYDEGFLPASICTETRR